MTDDLILTSSPQETASSQITEVTQNLQLEVFDEKIRRRELSRLTEMAVVAPTGLPALEDDLIENIRLYKISELVYQKDEDVTDKFTTVFNTLASYQASIFVLMDSNGEETDFYLGVRSNGDSRSMVTLGESLKNTLVGHFPGSVAQNQDRKVIGRLTEKMTQQANVTAVSVVGNTRSSKEQTNEQFLQGLEKLALAMNGKKYTGLILAQNSSPHDIQMLRGDYQELYSKLVPLQKTQISSNTTEGSGKNESFLEMSAGKKAALIGQFAVTAAGPIVGGVVGGAIRAVGAPLGAIVGGQLSTSLGSLITSFTPTAQHSTSESTSVNRNEENKTVTDLLKLIDEQLARTDEFDSYGMWQVAGYFMSDDMSAAEIAASNYRALMRGEKSGREVSAINSWRQGMAGFTELITTLSRFIHPQFIYGTNQEFQLFTNAATAVSGKELGLQLGLPRRSVPGLPVIHHAEFGKEVHTYQLFDEQRYLRPEERLKLGRVFDLGQVTEKTVELANPSLNMHTFITGSTGSGKSNTVYQMLLELRQDGIPFLVVEPAKGEYKDVFGHLPDVRVFSTNPKVADLLHINPFQFPESVHVLEHVDGLVEIFSVCWPMYDAMPAFFKEAILKSYEVIGWDLGSSTFDGKTVVFPDFEILKEQLEQLIQQSDYDTEVKSNYKGALLTRVNSLTVGLNRFLFSRGQTPYDVLFDHNCILDLSRVKSSETKALLMGLTVYLLNEYRMEQQNGSNVELQHVTVLEEAHNLLRNSGDSNQSQLIQKSVEMLTDTIAEIRTYGEGFIIVDQSPSSVDISAIKNTNTKIVLRTPEDHDRQVVGRSMGLTSDQINEIAKLPSGVAVVYQNDWLDPVLTLVDKAAVTEEAYQPIQVQQIKPLREARTDILQVILQPWLKGPHLARETLQSTMNSLVLAEKHRYRLKQLLAFYEVNDGQMVWRDTPENMVLLRELVLAVLGITEKELSQLILLETPESLRQLIAAQTKHLDEAAINEIGSILVAGGSKNGH